MNNYQLAIDEVLDIIKTNTEIISNSMDNDTSPTALHRHGKTKLISAILTYQQDTTRIILELSGTEKPFNHLLLTISDVITVIHETQQFIRELADDNVTLKGLSTLDQSKLVNIFLTYGNLFYWIEKIMEDTQND